VTPGPPIERHALPRLTVVVPNLDGLEVLPDSLASIAALDYERDRLEVLVVDNGSTDGSVDFVRRRFPEVRIVQHDRNLGFAAACNSGARAAREAEVVAFLNNDMRFEPDFLVELVAPLVRRECAMTTAKLLSWDGRAIDTSGTGTTLLGIAVQPGYGEPPRPEHDVPRKTLFGCGGAMAVRAPVLQDVGGFDEEYFAYYEDLDLGWRMWMLGHEVHYVPTAVGYHHHSHTSKRFPPEVVRLVMIRNSLATCIKNYDDQNLLRVLPAMLALAVRRAHLKSGLDERPFRIEASRPARPNVVARFRAALTGGNRTVPIERIGAADLIAIDDLLSDWEHWMRRRREIQERRRRGDDEIQRLFLDPLACVEGDAAYAALQAGLFELYGLDRTFGRS
jgi:GT2 family glycosyltransferase